MELLTWLLILFTLLVANVCWLVKKWYDFVRKYDKLPGPKPRLPLVGNSLLLLNKSGSITERMNELFEELYTRHKHDGMYLVFIGPRATLYVHEPQLASDFLRDKNFTYKSSEFEFFVAWLGNGLEMSNGQMWKAKRKMLNPAFHSDLLNNFIPLINEQVAVMMKIIAANAHREYIDVHKLTFNLAVDVITSTAMGVPLGVQKGENNEYVSNSHRAAGALFNRVYNPLLWSDFIFYKTKIGKQFKEDVKFIDEFTMNVVRNRKEKFLNKRDEHKDDEKNRKALLDLLISHQASDNSLSDQDILDEVKSFIIAAIDTTSTALSWTFLLIGSKDEVRRKVVEEIDAIFGDDKEREIIGEDLSKMIFLECAIKEAMRLYPPVPSLGRLIPNDIEITGFTVPKGTSVWINVLKVHHNEELFPNASEYKPERFLPEKVNTSKFKGCFMGFGAGMRDCIGQRLAMFEMKLALAHILRIYSVTALDDENSVEKTLDLTYRPKGEVRIKFMPR